jgi:hypothetical protein
MQCYFSFEKGSGKQRWLKGSERGDVSYANGKKKGSRMPFRLESFPDRISGTAFWHVVTKIYVAISDITPHVPLCKVLPNHMPQVCS